MDLSSLICTMGFALEQPKRRLPAAALHIVLDRVLIE
jgi:hypothetical protein